MAIRESLICRSFSGGMKLEATCAFTHHFCAPLSRSTLANCSCETLAHRSHALLYSRSCNTLVHHFHVHIHTSACSHKNSKGFLDNQSGPKRADILATSNGHSLVTEEYCVLRRALTRRVKLGTKAYVLTTRLYSNSTLDTQRMAHGPRPRTNTIQNSMPLLPRAFRSKVTENPTCHCSDSQTAPYAKAYSCRTTLPVTCRPT